MALLDRVKTSLGITTTTRNDDILMSIEAAKQDMRMRGVDNINEADDYTAQTIIMYCRGWYNFQGDGERYNENYGKRADSMAVSLDYKES